jgi:methyltransferase (TIGR00027 family)
VNKGKASVSAMGSAILRAAHVKEDAPPWVLEDTQSAKLLSESQNAAIERSMDSWPPSVRAGFRLTHAVRARVAEDAALKGLKAGCADYVILGAGLDSFAVRSPEASKLHIWEVDHPATQAWKRAALKRTGIAEPSNVTYVSADLSVDRLHHLGLPSLATWNWLGVTMYLEKADTVQVLRDVGSRENGTVLVANFLLERGERSDLGNQVQSEASKLLNAVGEPVLASYTKAEIGSLMNDAGFSSTEILEASHLTERYLKDRNDLVLPSSTIIVVGVV